LKEIYLYLKGFADLRASFQSLTLFFSPLCAVNLTLTKKS
jgi:hypothetical protein